MNIRKTVDYSTMFATLESVMKADLPQMELYCEIGKIVCARSEKGAAVAAAEFLKEQYPDMTGISPRNVRRMRNFWQLYSSMPELLGEALCLNWTQNVVIMEAELPTEERRWYIRQATARNLSKAELLRMIEDSAYLESVLDEKVDVWYNEGNDEISERTQYLGGFAPNSQTAEVLSKALGNRTVLSGSVSRGKNDPSQSLQMMERPLLTPDELKSIPKGNFIVQKTGQHPMRTRLRLFLEWGISFEEPYIVPERVDRAVAYANREDLERNLPQSSKAENADMRGAYAVSGRGGIAHEPAVDKPRRRGGKQMKTYGEEDL